MILLKIKLYIYSYILTFHLKISSLKLLLTNTFLRAEKFFTVTKVETGAIFKAACTTLG